MDVTVDDNRERHRFEALTDSGEVAGYAMYTRHAKVLTFTHTIVETVYEGQGIGSVLVRHSLDTVRERKLCIVPQCPFFASFIGRHPEYADLVHG